MKKLLLASTALVLSAGVAAADVVVDGDGRMGIISNFDNPATTTVDESDLAFTSRIRIRFTASGETDGGLSFGGSVRAHDAGGGNAGTAGSVFIKGSFGTLTMGDTDNAAEAAVGNVSGVGLTGLSDLNDTTYLGNSSAAVRPVMRYDSVPFGSLSFHVSADNPRDPNPTVFAVAVKYDTDAIDAGLGYESAEDIGTHIVLGGSATFGAATLKAMYGMFEAETGGPLPDFDQYGLSVDYKIDALTLTAFYRSNDPDGADSEDAYGIGADYSLGGGANLEGGYVRNDATEEDAFDFGIRFTF